MPRESSPGVEAVAEMARLAPRDTGAHSCGPACVPGWILRDMVEFGAVYGTLATQAVIAWDSMHQRRPVTCPAISPEQEGVTYG